MSNRQARLLQPLLAVGAAAWFAAFFWASWQRDEYYAGINVTDFLPNPPPPFWVEHQMPFSIAVALGAVLVALVVATVWRANE